MLFRVVFSSGMIPSSVVVVVVIVCKQAGGSLATAA